MYYASNVGENFRIAKNVSLMMTFADVIAHLRPAYSPMMPDGKLSPNDQIEIQVRYPDGQLFGRNRFSWRCLRMTPNVDRIIRRHRRQVLDSGIVLGGCCDPAPMERD